MSSLDESRRSADIVVGKSIAAERHSDKLGDAYGKAAMSAHGRALALRARLRKELDATTGARNPDTEDAYSHVCEQITRLDNAIGQAKALRLGGDNNAAG